MLIFTRNIRAFKAFGHQALKRLASKEQKADDSAFQRLYNGAQEHKKRLAVARAHANEVNNLTFHPKILRRSPGHSGRRSGTVRTRETRQKRFDSLYSDAKKTQMKIEKARKKIEAQEQPFRPKITSRGRRSPSPEGRRGFSSYIRTTEKRGRRLRKEQ